jgi:type I restriction enzyme S subunit
MEVNSGYKETEIGTIPLDWEVRSLGEIGEVLIGLTYSPSDVRQHGTLVLRSSNIQDDALAFNDNVFVDAAIPERIMVKPDDVLICVRNGSRDLIGKSALLDERTKGMTFGAFMAVFRSPIGRLSSYFFQSSILKRQIEAHLGATINQITNKSLNSFKVPLPCSEAERSAITIALNDVDELIAAQERLIAKKRDIKQAVMQQLLTRQARLPGFNGEWKEKPLGDVVQIKKGQLITTSTLIPGDVPVIAGGKQAAYFHAAANRTGRTITISASGANAGYVALYNEPIFASDCSTISEAESYSLDFIYFLLLLNQEAIYKAQTGGAQPHVHARDLNPLTFSFPEANEQAAIAQVLTDMEAEIRSLNKRREKTRAIKQGMMQQLLTGKVRLV